MVAVAAAAPAGRRAARSWPLRVAVEGHSMEPTLRAGDWLLVDPAAYHEREPSRGSLVVARDPGTAGRWLVKRVGHVDRSGRLVLVGDHPGHAAGASPLLAVTLDALIGRPWLRYRPVARFGRVR